MINLLIKDFKLIYPTTKDLKKRIFSSIFYILIFISFITIETFLFSNILNKIKNYQNAPISFLTLFLFIVSILMIILGTFQTKKLLFNTKDLEQLTTKPIPNKQIILSKLLFLFLMQYVTTLLFTYPLFVSYGIIMKKMAYFYYIALFYPVFTFLYEAGIILLLVYPIKLLFDYLKKHLIFQFIFSVVLLFILCFVYSKVLNVFIQLVTKNQLDSLLNVSSINRIISIKKYFIPIRFLIDALILSSASGLFPFFCISIGLFGLGLTVGISCFQYFQNLYLQNKSNSNKNFSYKEKTITSALIKKEFILLFKDSGYILSFTGLLMIQPFLLYLVIFSMNTIFQSGVFTYYIALLPNFVPLFDLLLILLFTLIIHQGANQYISMEKKQIKIIKMIPVSFKKQLMVKSLIPYVLSEVSLLISCIILKITRLISWNTLIFGFILTSLVLIVFVFISLIEELKIKVGKEKNTFLSTLFSYVFPIFYFLIGLGLSFLHLPIIVVYTIGIVLIGFCVIGGILYLKNKLHSLFLELEVVN